METEAIRSALYATIKSVAPDTDLQRIRPDLPLRPQIDLDSMDWLNLVIGLHAALSIEIPESDYGQLASLDAIIAYVASRKTDNRGEALPATAATTPLPCTSHLVNGTRVVVRPMRPEDMPLEADFVRHLSDEARYERFMLTLRELPQVKLKYLTDVDQVRHVALAATVERDGREMLVGVARYIVDPAGTGCEFAIAVDDAWQGSGLAGIMMQDVIDVARSRGLATMEGFVLASNIRMLKFARQLGFRQQRNPEDRDTVRVVRAL